MKKFAVIIGSQHESAIIQTMAFEKGYTWSGDDRKVFIYSKDLKSYVLGFNHWGNRDITNVSDNEDFYKKAGHEVVKFANMSRILEFFNKIEPTVGDWIICPTAQTPSAVQVESINGNGDLEVVDNGYIPAKDLPNWRFATKEEREAEGKIRIAGQDVNFGQYDVSIGCQTFSVEQINDFVEMSDMSKYREAIIEFNLDGGVMFDGHKVSRNKLLKIQKHFNKNTK